MKNLIRTLICIAALISQAPGKDAWSHADLDKFAAALPAKGWKLQVKSDDGTQEPNFPFRKFESYTNSGILVEVSWILGKVSSVKIYWDSSQITDADDPKAQEEGWNFFLGVLGIPVPAADTLDREATVFTEANAENTGLIYRTQAGNYPKRGAAVFIWRTADYKFDGSTDPSVKEEVRKQVLKEVVGGIAPPEK